MHKYLQEHILEEIKGAVDYWTKAVENKTKECGMIFRHMADMELEHANALTKMFTKLEKEADVTDEAFSKMHKDILDAYAEGMTKIEAMKKLYYS